MIVTRGNSTYYYRSKRVGGKPVKEFVCGGAGLWGELAAAFQSEDEDARAEAREARARERAEAAALAAELARAERGLARLASVAVGAARELLESLGYHLVARGRWRKKRGARPAMSEATMTPATMPATTTQAPAPAPDPAPPDPARRAAPITWETISYLDFLPGSYLDETFTDKEGKASKRRVASKAIAAHANDLAGPDPSPVERALAISAAVVWGEMRVVEAYEIGQWTGQKEPDNRSLAAKELARKHTDRLRRRYAHLLKTLADVRRLAGPALVVNVAAPGAQQQVNVGPAPHAPPASLQAVREQ